MRNIKYALLAIFLIGFIAIGVINVRDNKQKIQLEKLEVKSKETQLIELNTKYDEVIKLQTNSEKEKQEQLKQIQELEQERQRLEGELQAKRQRQKEDEERIAQAAQRATGTATVQAAPTNGKCNTGNKYKDFIYYKESTCNPAAVNHIGCRGIGQACPGSKLPCGADFACQDAWFSNYAMQRYGSWEAAYNFWVANNWW